MSEILGKRPRCQARFVSFTAQYIRFVKERVELSGQHCRGPSSSQLCRRIFMAYLREAKATDLLRMTRCNLDPLTESYHLDFYLHYLTTWPRMFIVAEDQKGDICGYGLLAPAC